MSESMNKGVSPEALKILKVLQPGNNHYIAASEMDAFAELAKTDYINAWPTQHGVPMWYISQAGLNFLASLTSEAR